MSLLKSINFYARLWVKRYLPEKAIRTIRKPFRSIRSIKRSSQRRESPPLSLSMLINDIKKAGVDTGDIIMVHSSLSRIGNVEGGAETVIKSFIEVVGENGTIIMPCYNSAEVAMKELKQNKFVDLRASLSATGIISETFRTWPGVVRSSHPFSSSCAWGKEAEFVTSGHAIYPQVCHAESPVGQLVKLNGKVVGIGIPIAQGLGVAHYLEDTWDGFPFEVHLPPFEMSYIDSSGKKITRDIVRFDPVIARTRIDYPEGAWICEKLMEHLKRRTLVKTFRYGQAESWIAQAIELYEELKRLAAKGVTMYLTPDKLTSQNRDIDNW